MPYASNQFDIGDGDVQRAGQKSSQVPVSQPLSGRGTYPQFQSLIVNAHRLVLPGASLHGQADNQVFPFPSIPVFGVCHSQGVNGCKNIFKTWITTSAISGEKSSPPMAGMALRIRFKTGALS